MLASLLQVTGGSAHGLESDDLSPGRSAFWSVAHRGASGYRPEHTLPAYKLAIRQCADYLEPDLVMTKDGVPVVRHENELSLTTDVAARPEFADRFTTKVINGNQVSDWFSEDFTLAELQTLRAVERMPVVRPRSARFDGRWRVITFAQVLSLASRNETCAGRPVGVMPEIKRSTYFHSIGLAPERPVMRLLRHYGFKGRRAPAVVQSMEVDNLRWLDARINVPLMQLVRCKGAPADQRQAGTGLTYDAMTSRRGMRTIAEYADHVGLCKEQMIPRTTEGRLGSPTSAIRYAHRFGLRVVGWTFRAENMFLPVEFRSSPERTELGDQRGEIRAFLSAGMDAFMTDQPPRGPRNR